jgi:hypothetical protein
MVFEEKEIECFVYTNQPIRCSLTRIILFKKCLNLLLFTVFESK